MPSELKQPLYKVEPHISSADFLTFFKGFIQIVMTADFSAEYYAYVVGKKGCSQLVALSLYSDEILKFKVRI